MRIIVVGATGTIGKAVVAALQELRHEVLAASRKSSLHVDISDPASIKAMYRSAGRFDAVVSAAGDARFKPFPQLTDDDYQYCLANKLMGQANLVRYGMDSIADNGSFTLTTGVLAKN
ncbi:MAG TPA: SDR family NAD(P)-dependent oxidoreductase, partial [Usitatibacter sp.]|nr:SDR family NAD(P)-dependent oxidoreductase [Usitatibacter sp.]